MHESCIFILFCANKTRHIKTEKCRLLAFLARVANFVHSRANVCNLFCFHSSSVTSYSSNSTLDTLQRLSVWFYEGIFKSRLKIKPAASLGLVPPCCGGAEVTEFGRSPPIGSPRLSIFLCIYLSFLSFCWQVLNLSIYEG